VFLPKPLPFSFPLFPSNIFDSFCRTGSYLVPGCQSRFTVTGSLITDASPPSEGDRRETEGKKKKSLLKKLPKQTLFHQQMFGSSHSPFQEFSGANLETKAGLFVKQKVLALTSTKSRWDFCGTRELLWKGECYKNSPVFKRKRSL
jgi:hypothetical protein